MCKRTGPVSGVLFDKEMEFPYGHIRAALEDTKLQAEHPDRALRP